jgi:hypothetical protein
MEHSLKACGLLMESLLAIWKQDLRVGCEEAIPAPVFPCGELCVPVGSWHSLHVRALGLPRWGPSLHMGLCVGVSLQQPGTHPTAPVPSASGHILTSGKKLPSLGSSAEALAKREVLSSIPQPEKKEKKSSLALLPFLFLCFALSQADLKLYILLPLPPE